MERDKELTVCIALRVNRKPLLTAIQRAKASPLNDVALLGAFFKTPLMTLKVIAGIHFEALVLWLKGMKIKPRKQRNPTSKIIVVNSGDQENT